MAHPAPQEEEEDDVYDVDSGDNVSMQNLISNLQKMDITSDAQKEHVHDYLQKLCDEHGLIKRYSAPLPMLVNPREPFNSISVLCVFLGPSSQTAAESDNPPTDWNPFRKQNPRFRVETRGNFTSSLMVFKPAEGHPDLNRCYLVDAFPLLYWGGKNKNPTPGAYVAHFRLGKAYIKEVIRVINPSVIMSFGIQACHVVFAALHDSDDSVPNMSQFDFRFETIIRRYVYFCKHPSSRVPDKLDLPTQAWKKVTKLAKRKCN